MEGANVLVPSVESSICKSAPSVRFYYCNLCEKYTIALIVLLCMRNRHALSTLLLSITLSADDNERHKLEDSNDTLALFHF